MSDPIQDLLRAWAALHEAKPAQLEALTNRVSTAIASHRHYVVERPAIHFPFYQKLGYACAGGLVVVMGFALVALLRTGKCETARVPGIGLASSGQAERDISAQTLFKEVSRLFPQQLRWIAQSNGEVGLGLESDATSSIPDTPAMSIRLVVLSRKAPEMKWREAWTTEIIVHAEDLVEVTPSRQSNNRMQFWVFPLQNGKIAVETDMTLEYPLTIASRLNTVVGIGAPAEVATVRMEDVEYKILQTVKPLQNTVDAQS